MNLKKTFAYLRLTIAILIWASIYHVAKYLISEADAFTLGFLRFFIATLVLLVIYFYKHGIRNSFTRPDSHWLILMLIGLIGIFGYNIFFFGAESIISANEVAIFFAFTPCITLLFGRVILKQKVRPLAYVGIVIALIGTVGVITLSSSHAQSQDLACSLSQRALPWGQILAILSSVAMASYNVLNKKASKLGLDPLTITTFSALFGTVFLFVTFLLFGGKINAILHKPLTFWLALAYIAIIATVCAYKWYSDAICELGVGQAAVFQNGVPLFAVLMGVVVLGDTVSLNVILSGVVIIIGVILTNLTIPK